MKDPDMERKELLEERERLEKESLRQSKLDTRADLWMRVFRGGMVLTSALLMYSLVFLLLGRSAWGVLVIGVLLLLFFLIIERIFHQRSLSHRKKKADLREEYLRVCDRLDELK